MFCSDLSAPSRRKSSSAAHDKAADLVLLDQRNALRIGFWIKRTSQGKIMIPKNIGIGPPLGGSPRSSFQRLVFEWVVRTAHERTLQSLKNLKLPDD
jgi:hypothetical protein